MHNLQSTVMLTIHIRTLSQKHISIKPGCRSCEFVSCSTTKAKHKLENEQVHCKCRILAIQFRVMKLLSFKFQVLCCVLVGVSAQYGGRSAGGLLGHHQPLKFEVIGLSRGIEEHHHGGGGGGGGGGEGITC